MHMSEVVKGISKKKALLGAALLLAGLTVLLLTYWPVISAYIHQYSSPQPSTSNVVIAKEKEDITKKVTKGTESVVIDSNFGIYIPKIKSNSKVVKNVDPFNESEYTNALQTGVAHAKGTYTPNVQGNVFLFAHSAVNFYERNKYDVYFYLLGQLKKNDEIYLSYEGKIYKYLVSEVKIVDKKETKYLSNYDKRDTLTLMTCYPAGTDWRRTIIVAYRDELNPIISK